MRKTKIVSSSNMIGKKRRNLQQYFDIAHNQVVTPNQRSLPKYKNIFAQPKKDKSLKKDQMGGKRQSQGRIDRNRPKESNSPPHRPHRSNQKYNRFEQSINRQYDSPSKDHQEIDFIVKGVQKKSKGNTFIEATIQKVNEQLKGNRLSEAIMVLKEALQAEPNHADLQYLLGISFIFNGEYEHAIVILQEMMRHKPKKNLYLLLSVCYKKTQKFLQTEEILNLCIKNYPKYYEAYIYRGKLYLKLKQYKQAMADFDKAISLDSNKQIAYVGKGDCLRLMEKYQDARNHYTAAYNSSKKGNISLLLRRAICSMQLKRYETALEDINRLLDTDFQNSEAHYFKGLIFSKLKQPNDAIISYQQAIKHNSNKRAVTRAIYQITKIKIENRDYYEALFTLERAEYLDIDEKVVKRFRIFINGVTAMMKKNYQEGIKILTQLLEEKDKPLSNFLKPLFYSTRSYGYMSLEKYQNAKQDLEAMEAEFSLDLPNLYNKFVCEGIIACNNQKYEDALKFFSKAAKAEPKRIQPAFYKALTLIIFSVKLLPKDMKDKKRDYLESAMKTISKQEKENKKIENNPSLFMIRGLLHYALGDLDSALKDFDQCLNQSTKPNPMVFYLIGLIFAETGKYGEAISQFKRAIENDDKNQIPEAYLSRAKCMILSDQVNTGFIDLQTYMTKKNTPEIHIWAGHLLFYIQAYEDANRAYANINNIHKNFDVLFYRVKCYLIVKDVLNALNYMKMMLDVKKDPKIAFDYEILECLRECSEENFQDFRGVIDRMKAAETETKGEFGVLIQQHNYQFYKGVMHFYSQDYTGARNHFVRALNLIEKYFQENEGLTHDDEQFFSEFNSLSFSNLSFNYHEIHYNISICHLLEGNYTQAHRSLLKIVDNLPAGQVKDEYTKLMSLIMQKMQSPEGRANNGEEGQIMPFPVENRLCSIFPQIVLPLGDHVRTRIFFCLPHVKKPDITPKFQQKILEQFTISSIQIKPQAPWIRRSQEGVIFTDEVVKYDIEISQSSSSEQDKTSEEEDEDYVANAEELFEENRIKARKEISDDDNYGQEDEQEQPQPRLTGMQLKELFKLDKLTEERLGRINKN